jgi:CubicO group peptidase (beta-lactamase class C family)
MHETKASFMGEDHVMKLKICILFLLVFTGICAQNPRAHWMQYASPEEAGFSGEKLEAVERLYDKNGASALMVIYKGHVLMFEGDIARKFHCHSIRKSLISGLYGIYVRQGLVHMDRTLDQLGIDDAAGLTEEEKSASIRDLLKSRSGVYIPAFGEAQSMIDSRPRRGSHAPGTCFYYNNWDFNVLGVIFQQQTHMGLFAAFHESVADPLRMEDFNVRDGIFWSDSTRSTSFPKYDFKMSTRDLARFGLLYCNGGKWDRGQILSREWITESFTPYSQIDQGSYEEGYGYCWWIETLDDSIAIYSARGWGGHILTVIPEEELVLVKRHDTYNSKGGDGWTGIYVRQILQAKVSSPKPEPALVSLETAPPEQMEFIHLAPGQLKAYEQSIILDGRQRKIVYSNGELLFEDWFLLHPLSDTLFYMEDVEKFIHFRFVEHKPVFDRME